MAHTIERVFIGQVREEQSNGTGSATIYVLHVKSPDGVVDVCWCWCIIAPSTDDTFPIGSLWTDVVTGKFYNKTGASTWVEAT